MSNTILKFLLGELPSLILSNQAVKYHELCRAQVKQKGYGGKVKLRLYWTWDGVELGRPTPPAS